MSYLVCAPIYWIPFDPPLMAKEATAELDPETLARMVLYRGLIAGPGLEQLLGRALMELAIDEGMVEPIP